MYSTFSRDPAEPGSTSPVLIDPLWLAENVGRSDLAVIEVVRGNDDPAQPSPYVAGAQRVHWQSMAWADGARDFADGSVLSARLGRLGISRETNVVVVGDPIQFGIYVAWALMMGGHRRVGVSDGGKAFWLASSLPTTSRPDPVGEVLHEGTAVDGSSRASRDDVRRAIDSSSAVLVDFRTEEEYTGQRVSPVTHAVDNGAVVAGRIPGARSLFYQRLLGSDGRFRPRDELMAEFSAIGVDGSEPIITYCRMGHRASLGRFVAHNLIGFPDVRVYDGSWTEWGSMVGMPVER